MKDEESYHLGVKAGGTLANATPDVAHLGGSVRTSPILVDDEKTKTKRGMLPQN